MKRLCLGVAFVLFVAACGDDSTSTTTTAPATTTTSATTGTRISVFDLKVGDCFNDPEDLTQAEVTAVPTVDCSEPHDNEIYFEYSMTDAVFPGDEEALDAASLVCLDEFDAFVGTANLDSELDLFPIAPTDESWAEGDRVVYCAIYALDLSKLEGSMRGSRR